MGKGLIIAVVIIVIILAVLAYMFLYQGGVPSVSEITETVTGGAAEIAIDERAATTTATQAEETVSELEGELGAADNLELPDIE